MITTNEKTVTVNRKLLLETVKENLAKHVKDYNEAVLGYKVKLVADLQEAIIDVNSKEPADLKGLRPVQFNFPVSHASEYEEIILMLEWSVDDTITIDSRRLQEYVMNKFAWSAGVEFTNNLYKGYAVAAKLI